MREPRTFSSTLNMPLWVGQPWELQCSLPVLSVTGAWVSCSRKGWQDPQMWNGGSFNDVLCYRVVPAQKWILGQSLAKLHSTSPSRAILFLFLWCYPSCLNLTRFQPLLLIPIFSISQLEMQLYTCYFGSSLQRRKWVSLFSHLNIFCVQLRTKESIHPQ